MFVALVVFCSSVFGQADTSQTRPRTVSQLTQQTADQATPQTSTPVAAVKESAPAETTSRSSLTLTPPLIQSRITEAERLLKSKPMTTALTTTPNIEFVTVAALDRLTQRTHLITLSKETFLKKGSEITLPSSLGTQLTIRVLRANGVNTALTISTPEGKELLPLTVEYPIEHNGLFKEMAYYTSAHPALLSKDLVNSGQAYVHNMLDLAVRRLGERGVAISPDILNVAERLCIVEHIDHERFRAENRLALYDEIYSLYALNQLDTYRYSVSSAGAGGMVQMIPWAYNLIRQRHPGVGLIPDFVTGMRNHANALQAMLLYMQDTWNDLTANEDIKYALNAKIASTPELLAAAYNSNAAKLPGYIRRGNEDWRLLIPRETQMYLQIYKSFEGLVPMKPHSSVSTVAEN